MRAGGAALTVLVALLAAGRVAAQFETCDAILDATTCTDSGCDWLENSCSEYEYSGGGYSGGDDTIVMDCSTDSDCFTPEICELGACYDQTGGGGGGDQNAGGGGSNLNPEPEPEMCGRADSSCPAGQYSKETYIGAETRTDCSACQAGQYYGGGQQKCCIDCVANTYVDVTGSDEASDCIACPNNGVTKSRLRDSDGHTSNQNNAAGWDHVDGCSGCEDGFSYRTETHSCVACPFPNRCNDGHCTEGAYGDGCSMCQTTKPRHYALGQMCQPCPDSTPWLFIFGSTFVAAGITMLLYKVVQAHESLGGDAEAANDARGDAEEVVALASSMYENRRVISIYISITMPHFQLLSILIGLDLGWPDIIKKAARFVADFLSFDFGSATTPECLVQTEDPQTLFLYKFAATHCAFAAIVVLLLVVAGVQSKRSGAVSFRKMLNTINAVSISSPRSSNLSMT